MQHTPVLPSVQEVLEMDVICIYILPSVKPTLSQINEQYILPVENTLSRDDLGGFVSTVT